MTPRLISEEETEPINVAEAGFNLKAEDDGTGSDPIVYVESVQIARLIRTARMRLEEATELSLITKILQVDAQSLGPPYILLPHGPVHSVLSVTYVDDDTGDDVVLDPSLFRLKRNWIRGVNGSALLIPAYDVDWPSSVRNDIESVRVQYTAGFPWVEYSPPQAVPDPIVQAMHLLIGHMYENRESIVVGVGAITTALELPQGVEWMIQPYRQNLGV